MRFEFKPSFYRSLEGLHPHIQEKAKQATVKVIDYYSKSETPVGLGITHLQGPFWEARVDIKTRVLWRKSQELIEFVLAGSHDEVKRFLKRI